MGHVAITQKPNNSYYLTSISMLHYSFLCNMLLEPSPSIKCRIRPVSMQLYAIYILVHGQLLFKLITFASKSQYMIWVTHLPKILKSLTVVSNFSHVASIYRYYGASFCSGLWRKFVPTWCLFGTPNTSTIVIYFQLKA